MSLIVKKEWDLLLTFVAYKQYRLKLDEPGNYVDALSKFNSLSDEEKEIHYIGREEPIKNKKASDRLKDRDDLRFLTGETPDII